MSALRSRPVASIVMGMLLAFAMVWSLSAWRASALPGAGESTVVAITPARILDTREGAGVGLAGRFVSATPRELQVTGAVPTTNGTQTVVPDGATGVLLNVTVVTPTANGFISVRPAGTPGTPETSSLNFLAGDIAPNSVQVAMPTAGTDAGKIEIVYDAYGQPGPETDVLVDVVAYTTDVGIQSLVGALASKADAPTLQHLTYNEVTMLAAVPAVPTKLREVGTFVKASDSTTIRLTWQSHATRVGGVVCSFQLRVGDVNPDGSTFLAATDTVVQGELSPIHNVTVWDDLPAGTHSLSIWVRGVTDPTCWDNSGNYVRSVMIEEFTSSPLDGP